MKKTVLGVMLLALLIPASCYAVDSQGNYEIVEGTVNTLIVGNQLSQIKRTFLLNKETGESFIFSDGKWFLMEKINSYIDAEKTKLKKAPSQMEEE